MVSIFGREHACGDLEFWQVEGVGPETEGKTKKLKLMRKKRVP